MSLLRILFASAQSHKILLKKICFNKKVLFLDQVYDEVTLIKQLQISQEVVKYETSEVICLQGPGARFSKGPVTIYPYPLKVFMQATTLFS